MNKIRVKINDNFFDYEGGITFEEISKDFKSEYEALACIVNNRLTELSSKLKRNEEFSYFNIKFLDITDKHGWTIYRRSLSFLFIKACKEVLPNAIVSINHTLNKGVYCELSEEIDQDIVKAIRLKMKELIEKDIIFKKYKMNRLEAIKVFDDLGLEDKVKLLKGLDLEDITVYDCEDYIDYFFGELVPSTGYLKMFEIFKVNNSNNAIIVTCPNRETPEELIKYKHSPNLINVYQERKEWAKIMGVDLLGNLNEIIEKEEFPELIRTMEALHENKIAKIAEQIVNEPEKGRVVLIAGPSSSGKTSFSKRLMLQLKVNGLKPIVLSTDDYFVDRELTPKDEFGNYDFESVYAVDLDAFNSDINKLLNGEEIDLPTFNFKEGRREYLGNKLKIAKGQPIIIEGIHALNPLLTKDVSDNYKFKIYISPLTQLNIDNHNRISTTDARMIRRIIRDNKHRGLNPQATISMWESLRRGEKKYIFPCQEDVDALFNSELTYELAVLKKYIVPLLKQIKSHEPEYVEAKRLLRQLECFKDIYDEADIPPTSILREFIGGSRLVH